MEYKINLMETKVRIKKKNNSNTKQRLNGFAHNNNIKMCCNNHNYKVIKMEKEKWVPKQN